MEKAKNNARLACLLVLYVLYIFFILKITVFRGSASGVHGVNFIPMSTIAEYLQSILHGNRIVGIYNIFGNIFVFLPLGYITSLLFPKMRKSSRILVFVVAFSLTIEVSQFICASGASDIDDVILNVLGGLIGYWTYGFITKLFKQNKYKVYISVLMIAIINLSFLAFTPHSCQLPVPAIRSALVEPRTDDNDKAERLILVNKWNVIPADYEADLAELENGQLVDKQIYHALHEMLDSARAEGIYTVIVSGYRTAKEQQGLLDNKISEYRSYGCSIEESIRKAETWVAVPGTSEHQLGIAVDINAGGIYSTGDEVYRWLNSNSYKFGFILRYPPNKTKITGIIDEPWHYRYVGVEAATEMYNQGYCLEEYLCP
jgi:D-alanyl-D-alanine carboxypeptidase